MEGIGNEKETKFAYIAVRAPRDGDVGDSDVSLEPMLNDRLGLFVFGIFELFAVAALVV